MGDQQGQQQQQMQMDSNIVKLRGLPWNVTPKEILQFLEGVQVDKGENGVHLITSPRDGRPNGEAFVECATDGDVAKAFEYQNKNLGKRYIEIFNAQVDEFESVLNKQHVVQMDTFIKLRGLPYSITTDEIEQFFDGLQLNKDQDVHIVTDNRGRASGEAFVRFGNLDDTEKALKRNREKIGHRYIEIFRSTNSEYRRSMFGNNRPGPYDRGNMGPGAGGMGMGNGGGGAGGGGGMGGGGPIRNNFNGPRGRMMRGGGHDVGNNGPWKGGRQSFDNFYEDDSYNGCGGGNNSNSFNNSGNLGLGMGGGGGGGGGVGGFGNTNSNGSGYRANNDYSMGAIASANRGFNNGSGVSGSTFSTSSAMGLGGGLNSFGSGVAGGGYNGNGAFGGGGVGSGVGLTGGMSGMGLSSGPMGGGLGNNNGVGGYRTNMNNNNNGNGGGGGGGYNDFGGSNQNNNFGNGGSNLMGNGGGGAWRDNGNQGGGGMNDTFCVHMRGMPYYCDEQDIYKFFAPLKPTNCQVIYNNRGLHSGEADAVFANQAEAMQAMLKNKEKMGTRYIELFYKSAGNNNNNNGGGGGGNSQNMNMNMNNNRRRF